MYRVHLFEELMQLAGRETFAGRRLLEIGPKEGNDSLRLANLNPRELIMIDLPEKQSQIEKRVSRIHCPHRIISENLLYMAPAEFQTLGQFYLIWCTGVLYHNAEQLRLLRKLYNLMEVGGYLVLESATLRLSKTLRHGNYVEVHYPETYRDTGTITHLPSAGAIKCWLKMVGFGDIVDSRCYDKENKDLIGQRFACICRKGSKDAADVYYSKTGLNPMYRFGDST